MSSLALLGGEKAVKTVQDDMFAWPIINEEMIDLVSDTLRKRFENGWTLIHDFEKGFAEWHGVKYALGHNNGTSALHGAMFGIGLGRGDEIICPSITYWASCLPALSLGARVVFADIDRATLCLDPADIERHITPRTKAIMVVHYLGMPADMDRIMAVARKHKLKVIEDVSHAHGTLYKGKIVGSFGDAAGFSLMAAKSFAVGEAGMLVTDNKEVYERAILFGHYERHGKLTDEHLKKNSGIPWGGYKYRMHFLSAAVGVVQLKKYSAEIEEIQSAMNYYWDCLAGLPGLKEHRPARGTGSTMGGWYAAHGLYNPEELDGLSVKRFCDALRAEGTDFYAGCNIALHKHPVFNTVDVYSDGRPTQDAFVSGNIEMAANEVLPVTESIQERVCWIPWFKKFRKNIIDEHVDAVRKVVKNYKELLPGDRDGVKLDGFYGLSAKKSGK